MNIKLILLYTSLLAFLTPVWSQGKKEKAVTLSLTVLKELPHAASDSTYETPHPDIRLVLRNHTDSVASFYLPSCAWGDNAIRLELKIRDSIFILYYASFCNTRFIPFAKVLQPGDSMVILLKIEQCYQRGPCPCLYSLPRNFRFPLNSLKGAQLRAFYKADPEYLDQNKDIELEEAKRTDSLSHKKNTVLKKKEKYQASFVRSELVSNTVSIDFDAW